MAVSPLFTKIALVALATGAVGSAVTVPFVINRNAPPLVQKPLDKETLDKLVGSKGYKECLNFLSNKNPLSLLFVCSKTTGEEVTSFLSSDEAFYFWNGNSFKEAVSLTYERSNTNKVWVVLKDGSRWEINSEENESIKGTKPIQLEDNCEIQPKAPTGSNNGKQLSCHDYPSDSEEATERDHLTSNIFSLKKYDTFISSPTN